jgi:hypothetical protein
MGPVSAIDNVHVDVRDVRRALTSCRNVLGTTFGGDEQRAG